MPQLKPSAEKALEVSLLSVGMLRKPPFSIKVCFFGISKSAQAELLLQPSFLRQGWKHEQESAVSQEITQISKPQAQIIAQENLPISYLPSQGVE